MTARLSLRARLAAAFLTLATTLTTATPALSVGQNASSSKAAQLTTAASGWQAPKPIAPLRGNPTSVSCPSTTWCLSGDLSGSYQTFNGSSWSARKSVIPQAEGSVLGFGDISCPSTTFCLAVTTSPGYAVYRSGTWTLIPTGHPWDDVDCYSSTRCAIVADVLADDTTRIAFWNGSALAGETAPSGVKRLSSVSCSTATVCAAAGTNGTYAKFVRAVGTRISVSTIGQGHYGLEHAAISCVAWTFCLVATNDYSSWRWNGTAWTSAGETRDNLLLLVDHLVCTSSTKCIGTTDERAGRWNGTTWDVSELSTVPLPGGGRYGRAVDCAWWSMCITVDSRGRYQRWNGSSWSTPTFFNTSSGSLSDLSCPTATRCLATDSYGNALLFNGTSWSSPVSVLPNRSFVSCVSATWCLVVDSQSGRYRKWTGAWGPVTKFDGVNYYSSFACASTTNCFLFQGGTYRRFNGTTWSSFKQLLPYDGSASVTCPTTASCTAWDYPSGTVSRWNGSAWSTPRRIGLTTVYDVSCTNNSFCLALGESSTGLRYAKLINGVWSTAEMPSALSPGMILCQHTTSCLATNAGDGDPIWRWNGTQWAVTAARLGLPPMLGDCVGTWCMVTSLARASWTIP